MSLVVYTAADLLRMQPPDGYAVVTAEGAFVGVWKTRETAELVKNRGSAKDEIVRPILFARPEITFDLIAHLRRQREFSEKAFGPGPRTQAVMDHIRKELAEIEADPENVFEWIDIVLLGLDGAWRAGHTPEDIARALEAKQLKNEKREWPDWRTADPTKAIEHDRKGE